MWSVALLVLLGGCGLVGVIIAARLVAAHEWRSKLTAYRLVLPKGLSADDVAKWLTHLSGVTHPPLWSLFPMPPVGLEIVATASRGISHYLLVSKQNEAQVLSGLRSSLPGIRLEAEPEYFDQRPSCTVAA
jgi:hypothetical protein